MLPSRSRARGRVTEAGVASRAGASRWSCALRALQAKEPTELASLVLLRCSPLQLSRYLGSPGASRAPEAEARVQPVQELPSTLDAPARRRPGAPSPGNGGWSAGRSPRLQRRVVRTGRSAALHGGPSGLPGWGGAAASKVAEASPEMPDGEQTATHLSRVGRRVDPAPGFPPSGRGPPTGCRAPSFPRASGVRRRQAPGGAGGPGAARAGARTQPAPRPSLPPVPACSRPSPARGSGEPPRGPGLAAEGARGAKAPAECRPPRALPASALRSGTELGGARRALFPRFPKGHPGGGAP